MRPAGRTGRSTVVQRRRVFGQGSETCSLLCTPAKSVKIRFTQSDPVGAQTVAERLHKARTTVRRGKVCDRRSKRPARAAGAP